MAAFRKIEGMTIPGAAGAAGGPGTSIEIPGTVLAYFLLRQASLSLDDRKLTLATAGEDLDLTDISASLKTDSLQGGGAPQGR